MKRRFASFLILLASVLTLAVATSSAEEKPVGALGIVPKGGSATTADTNRDDGIVEAPMPTDASPTLEQSQRLASYLVAHSQFSSPIGRRTVLVSVLSEDPAIDRVSYETIEAP